MSDPAKRGRFCDAPMLMDIFPFSSLEEMGGWFPTTLMSSTKMYNEVVSCCWENTAWAHRIVARSVSSVCRTVDGFDMKQTGPLPMSGSVPFSFRIFIGYESIKELTTEVE